MLSAITGFIAVARALFELWKTWQNYQAAQKKIEVERKRQDLAKAIEDLKNAKTDEEVWNAQDSIARNKP